MALIPIFDTTLPHELEEKLEFELTKYENDKGDEEVMKMDMLMKLK